MIDTYFSDYFSEFCPECKKMNFWCNGDITDISGIDVEGLICWNCGHRWLLDMCEEWTNLEEAYIEKGIKEI